MMNNVELRHRIKRAVDRLPVEQLESLADYVNFLARPTLSDRLDAAEKAIAEGKFRDWREVRKCQR